MLLRNALRAGVPITSINNPDMPIYQALVGGVPSVDSGVTVNATTALRLPTLIRCIELIASVIASLPLKTYTGEGDSRVEVKRPSESYVWDRPNPEMTRQTFWEIIIASILANGNGYINTPRTNAGAIAELWPVRPDRVHIDRTKSGEKIYRIDDVTRTAQDIVHIPGFGTDGVYGLSKVGQMRQSLGINIAAEKFAARMFGGGGIVSGIIRTKSPQSLETAEAIKARWRQKHSGATNAWDVMVMDSDSEWINTMVPPEDAQFLETRKFQDIQIASMFGVPPHLVGIVDVSTSWGTGIEQQNIQFVNYTLRPLVTRLEQSGTAWLLPPAARYMRFVLDGLLRGDTAARTAYYHMGRLDGWLTPNNILRLEDMPPRTDPGGDEYQETPTGAAPNADTPTGDDDATD